MRRKDLESIGIRSEMCATNIKNSGRKHMRNITKLIGYVLILSVLPLFLIQGKTMSYKKVITYPEDYKQEKDDLSPDSISGTWLITEDKGIMNFLGKNVGTTYLLYIDKNEKDGEILLYKLYNPVKGTELRDYLDVPIPQGKEKIVIKHVGDGTYEIKYINKKRNFKVEYNGNLTLFFDDSVPYGSKAQKNGKTDGFLWTREKTEEPMKQHLIETKTNEEIDSGDQ